MAEQKTKINRFLNFFYLMCILSVALYAYKKPLYNWDVLPYMSVVLSYDYDDPKFIHDTAYEIAKYQIPNEIYKQLTDTSISYRKKMASDADAFYSQLPFYVVKPLYTGLIYLFYKAGFSLLKATVIPSVISYFLMGGLLFLWIRKYLQAFFAFIASLFIMLLAPVLEVLRDSTPDCLASFLLLAAFYFIIEKKTLNIAFLFFLFSVFARIENVIPCFFIISLLAYTNTWKAKVPVKKYIAMLAVLIICLLLITSGAAKYDWGILYYPSYAKHFTLPNGTRQLSSVKDYLILFYTHIVTGFFFSNLVLFVLLALITFAGNGSFQIKRLSFEQLFIITLILSIIIRYVLQPLIDDRYYVAYYLCVIILLIRKLHKIHVQ